MSSRKILVADDDIDSRVILRTLLEVHGYAVVEAANADDALAMANEVRFDLVILNYPMLTQDGSPLVTRLRADGAQEPILNITSRVIPQFIDDARRQGVTLSLSKPIDVENLLQVVRELTAPRPAVAN